MSTMEIILATIAGTLLFILAIVPLGASLGICAPKWWRAKVDPLLPSLSYDTRRNARSFKEGTKTVLKYVFFGMTFPVWGTLLGLVWVDEKTLAPYIKWCMNIIYKKCPYTCEHGNEVNVCVECRQESRYNATRL